LQAKIRATAQPLKKQEDWITRRGTQAPKPGELVLLRRQPGRNVVVYWLVALAHPDDADTLFLVLVDDMPASLYCGVCDVPLRTLRGETLIARCGHGVWAQKDRLERRTAVIVGQIHPRSQRRVRQMLCGMTGGATFHTAARSLAVANSLEYEEYERKITRTRYRTWGR